MLGKILIMSTILMSSCTSAPDNNGHKVEHPINRKCNEAIRNLFVYCQKQLDELQAKAQNTYNDPFSVSELLCDKSVDPNFMYNFTYKNKNNGFEKIEFTGHQLKNLFSYLDLKCYYELKVSAYRLVIVFLRSQFERLYQDAFTNELRQYNLKDPTEQINDFTDTLINLSEQIVKSNIFLDSVSSFLKNPNSVLENGKISNEKAKPIWTNLIENVLWNINFDNASSETDSCLELSSYARPGITKNKNLLKKVEDAIKKSKNEMLEIYFE